VGKFRRCGENQSEKVLLRKQSEEAEKKLDSRGPIIANEESDDIKEWILLRCSSSPLKRRINPLTGEPNKWILPIISNVNDNGENRMPHVIINGM
jgi:hypothetical protein